MYNIQINVLNTVSQYMYTIFHLFVCFLYNNYILTFLIFFFLYFRNVLLNKQNENNNFFSSPSLQYNSLTVSTNTITAFHFSRSWTLLIQFSFLNFSKSCFTPSNRRFIGRRIGLFAFRSHFMFAKTGPLFTCPNRWNINILSLKILLPPGSHYFSFFSVNDAYL